MFSDEDEKQDLQRQAGRRFTLAVPITDPLGLRPGKHLSSSCLQLIHSKNIWNYFSKLGLRPGKLD